MRGEIKNESRYKTDNKQVREPIRYCNCGSQGHKSTNCNSRNLGTKCFKCNCFGHRSFECSKDASKQGSADLTSGKVSSVRSITGKFKKMLKRININGFGTNMLIDTGSLENIIKRKVYESIGSPMLCESYLTLHGFGGGKIKALGYFQSNIAVDHENFTTTVYVVPDKALIDDGLIENDLLNEADVTINEDKVTITKRRQEAFLMNIRVQDDEDKISSYEPKKTKNANVEMKIILKNVAPISCSPR